MIKDDLIDAGIDPALAHQFVVNTAVQQAPEQASENSPTMGGPSGQTTYQTVDGGTLTEAEMQALIAKSNAANPGASMTYGVDANGNVIPGVSPQTDPSTPAGRTEGTPATDPPIDWHAYLSDWGFDTDMMNELDRIFKVYSDPNQAAAAGLAYIRGTDWYAQHFAGIGDAIKNGLVADEAGYRAYLNDANQYYRRFYGRDISTGELAAYFKKGYTSTNIGQHLRGEGAVTAEKGDIQYALGAFGDDTTQATPDQLSQYGDQVGGLDNLVGQQLQAKLDKAKARLNAVFQGTLGTPALNVVNGRLTSPSLAGGTTVGDVPS